MNNRPGKACPRCTLEDTPSTRSATKTRIGPWYVLQSRNPAAPGMKFQTLQFLVRKGFVTPQSVVRSPTTSQLWQSAAKVKGLSREFGLCYSCSGTIGADDGVCPHCNRSQSLPSEIDALLDSPQAKAGIPAGDPAMPLTPEAEVSTDEGIDGQASADVLSPRELAMVFQLGYDAPGTVQEPEVRRKRLNGYVVSWIILGAVVIIGGTILWVRSPSPHKHAALVQSVEQPPLPRIHLEPVVVAPLATAPVVAPAAAAPSPVDVSSLWNIALEAESHRDFATALKIYRRIQSLPAGQWPVGLQTRLKLAQHEMSAGTY